MTYKVNDLVYFDGDWKKGVGKIVAISGKLFLVHSTQIAGGHDGNEVVEKQDNKNNWFFIKEHLKPFTKKVGQKYKVIGDRISRVKLGELITLTCDWGDSISTYKQENGRKAWLYDIDHPGCVVEFYEDAEEYKGNEMFTKEDLKAGYLVRLRNGQIAHVVDTIDEGMCLNFEDTWDTLCAYDNDLTNETDSRFDIVEVYGLTPSGYKAHKFETRKRKPLWKREEVKEMTIEDIEKELGRKIKVIA